MNQTTRNDQNVSIAKEIKPESRTTEILGHCVYGMAGVFIGYLASTYFFIKAVRSEGLEVYKYFGNREGQISAHFSKQLANDAGQLQLVAGNLLNASSNLLAGDRLSFSLTDTEISSRLRAQALDFYRWSIAAQQHAQTFQDGIKTLENIMIPPPHY